MELIKEIVERCPAGEFRHAGNGVVNSPELKTYIDGRATGIMGMALATGIECSAGGMRSSDHRRRPLGEEVVSMNEQSSANRKAWNYRAYEFWCRNCGSPREYALKLLENPHGNITSRYTDLFVNVKGKRILNALGSNGRKAVPLCLLGAEVTIIDISQENRQYALELAQHAGVRLEYEVADFAAYHNDRYLNHFDIVFSEGGILHYFGDLKPFFGKLASYLVAGGELILNDFHPYRKILFPEIGTGGDYFESSFHEAPVAYEGGFDESERKAFPKCLLRYYTIGEIVTAIARSGLRIEQMRELRREDMEHLPGEFTIVANKT